MKNFSKIQTLIMWITNYKKGEKNMNIKCKLKELINGLNIVSKTSIFRTTMPILEGVLIEAKNNSIKLTTYDLEIGTEHTMDCEVIEEGKTVVDVKTLNEIVRRIENK